MAFNGPPNPPPGPPPPPHHGGPHPPPPPPPPPPPAAAPPNPFWDFIHAMDPNYRAGQGVDHIAPDFSHGFGFGPSGFEAWSGPRGFNGGWGRRGGHHHGRRRGPDRDGAEGWGGWGGWGSGGWDWPGPGHDNRGERRRERCGRHCRRNRHSDEEPSGDEMRDVAGPAAEREVGVAGEPDPEKAGSPSTMRGDATQGDFPDPPEEEPEGFQYALPHRGRGGGGHRGRGGPHHVGPHGGPRGHHGFRGPPPPGPAGVPPPPPYGPAPPFDFNALMTNVLGDNPFSQRIRSYVDQQINGARVRDVAVGNENEANDEEDLLHSENTFVPPVDIFNSTSAWTVHLALPGAKKEDIAINWDAAKGSLAVSGVVYRPGDEEFLTGLVNSERKVGLFERSIKLPPVGVEERDEIETDRITARMEDGVLIVVVPKVEKEWTEVKKVDIE